MQTPRIYAPFGANIACGLDTLDVQAAFLRFHAGLRAFYRRVRKPVFHRSDGVSLNTFDRIIPFGGAFRLVHPR